MLNSPSKIPDNRHKEEGVRPLSDETPADQPGRLERMEACRAAARDYLALCGSPEEVAAAERLLCLEICACAEDAARRFAGSPRVDTA